MAKISLINLAALFCIVYLLTTMYTVPAALFKKKKKKHKSSKEEAPQEEPQEEPPAEPPADPFSALQQSIGQLKWDDANSVNTAMKQILDGTIPIISDQYVLCQDNLNGDYVLGQAKLNLSKTRIENMQNAKVESVTYTPPTDIVYKLRADTVDIVATYKLTGIIDAQGETRITCKNLVVELKQTIKVENGKATTTAIVLTNYEVESDEGTWGENPDARQVMDPVMIQQKVDVIKQVNAVTAKIIGGGQPMWYEDVAKIVKKKDNGVCGP